jgi:hypothetical protein
MVLLAGRGGCHGAAAAPCGPLALEELVSRYPSHPTRITLGTYIAPDDPDAAAEEFQKELRSTRPCGSAVQMAHLKRAAAPRSGGAAAAERAASLVPDAPAGRLVLGRALLTSSERTRRSRSLSGRQLAPRAPKYFTLSRASQRAGRTEDAPQRESSFGSKSAPEP